MDLHRRAFDSRNMTSAWRLRTLQHPEYRPELDLVIESPEGRLAAFCTDWYDPAGPALALYHAAGFRHLHRIRIFRQDVA